MNMKETIHTSHYPKAMLSAMKETLRQFVRNIDTEQGVLEVTSKETIAALAEEVKGVAPYPYTEMVMEALILEGVVGGYLGAKEDARFVEKVREHLNLFYYELSEMEVSAITLWLEDAFKKVTDLQWKWISLEDWSQHGDDIRKAFRQLLIFGTVDVSEQKYTRLSEEISAGFVQRRTPKVIIGEDTFKARLEQGMRLLGFEAEVTPEMTTLFVDAYQQASLTLKLRK